MSEREGRETFPIFPIFLVIDVSSSMQGEKIQAVNEALPGIKTAIESDPVAGEIARVGIIAFSDTATPVLPLCDLQYANIPALSARGSTNFADAFRVARTEIEAQIRAQGKGTQFHTPVIFFLSDGEHTTGGDWAPALDALTGGESKFRPRIVTFGFGNANATELAKISTKWTDAKSGAARHYAFMAKGSDVAAQVREIIGTLVMSIKTTSQSLHPTGGGQDAGLVVQPDPGKFTALPLPVSTV